MRSFMIRRRENLLTAPRAGRARGGFTLIELMVVIFMVGIILAISVPQLFPVIASSTLEGAGRHLAGYGRAAIAQATMMQQEVTVYVDINQQEYWSSVLVYPDKDGEGSEGEPEPDQMKMLEEYRNSGKAGSPEEMSQMLAEGKTDAFGQGFDPEMLDRQLHDKFDRFAREATMRRAKNVKQDEGILDEIGPLFDKQFSLEEELEPTYQEITDPVLERNALPGTVYLESVSIGGSAYSKGVVEIPITPLGIDQEVRFFLRDENREYYTVVWDPISGGTNVMMGRWAQ